MNYVTNSGYDRGKKIYTGRHPTPAYHTRCGITDVILLRLRYWSRVRGHGPGWTFRNTP